MSNPSTLPKTAADINCTFGKAWRVDVAAIAAKNPEGAPAELTVAAWLVHAPWAHPLWHTYLISVISLRDVEGVPPAHINLPGATHEIAVIALKPEQQLAVDEQPILLMPVNFTGQFVAPDDAHAKARATHTVVEIITGKLSPDTDFRHSWVERYGDWNIRQGASA